MFAYPPATTTPVEASANTTKVVSSATLSVGTKRARVPAKVDDFKAGNTVVMQEASTSYVPVSHSPKSTGGIKRAHNNTNQAMVKADKTWTHSLPNTPKRSETTFATGDSSRNSDLVRGEQQQSEVDAKQLELQELTSETLCNPTRVVPAQVKLVHFPESSRFVPLLPKRAPSGFVMLQDCAPSEPAEYVWDVDVYTQATPQSPFGALETVVERTDAHHQNPFLHP